ncbi:MAG: polyphenol oxidase family protein [Treponema sp.]|jgi:YfiH family protein|nr:polyphenol oxidase family protein [Treponema sp.]
MSAAALYPFTLNFSSARSAAFFPFMFDGKEADAGGTLPAPSCVISAREAGDMRFNPAAENPARERFFSSLGMDPAKVYSLSQVHSLDVFAVDAAASPAAFTREGDGMVCGNDSVFLAVTVADCLPVFLLDTESGAFAALHSGWRGTGIVNRALALMAARYRTRALAVAAVLGPCIQGCCYRVDEARFRAFGAEFGAARRGEEDSGPAAVRRGGAYFLDMRAANIRLLAAAGVRNIAYCKDCTFEDGRLGSYRREGAENYTRMVSAAGYFGPAAMRVSSMPPL